MERPVLRVGTTRCYDLRPLPKNRPTTHAQPYNQHSNHRLARWAGRWASLASWWHCSPGASAPRCSTLAPSALASHRSSA